MWKGHKSIFGAFSPMNMNAHSVAVDIGNLKVKDLLQSKPAGVNRRQKDIIVKCFNLWQNTVDCNSSIFRGSTVNVPPGQEDFSSAPALGSQLSPQLLS